MTDKLPASERVAILSNRIANLNKGSGDYALDNRVAAINSARRGLEVAQRDLARGK